MHTDEYEISIGREVTLCRKLVKRLEGSLEKREQKHGMTTDSFMQALEQGRLEDLKDFHEWLEDYRQLQHWRKMLNDYQEALRALK